MVVDDDSVSTPSTTTAKIPASVGSSSLATSLSLKEAQESKEETSSSGKRERTTDDFDFKGYIGQCYQHLVGDSLNLDQLSSEEAYATLQTVMNSSYHDNDEFKKRMAFLQEVFRKEVDAPIPDVYGTRDIVSKGYSLLATQSFIISQVCKRIRESQTFDLIEIFHGLEFVNNIADLNLSAIKIGIGSGGFEASKEFINAYKSGGTLDDITSKQQEKARKKGEKAKENEKSKVIGFRKKPNRNDGPKYNNFNNGYNNNNSNNQYGGYKRRFSQYPNSNGSNSSSNNNTNNNNVNNK